MSQAHRQATTHVFHNELDLARTNTMVSTLRYYLSRYHHWHADLRNEHARLNQLIEDQIKVRTKRKRLMDQNFSSAPHLRKTHTRYWQMLQHYSQSIYATQRDIQTIQSILADLTRKIQDLRKSLSELVMLDH